MRLAQSLHQEACIVELTSYYRRFIAHFASLAGPLMDLTWSRLPGKVTWTKETNKAFQDLKESLCSRPVLVIPEFSNTLVQTVRNRGRFHHITAARTPNHVH